MQTFNIPTEDIGPIRFMLYQSRFDPLWAAHSIHHPPEQIDAWALVTVRKFGEIQDRLAVCIPIADDESPQERRCQLENGLLTLEYLCANPTESF